MYRAAARVLYILFLSRSIEKLSKSEPPVCRGHEARTMEFRLRLLSADEPAPRGNGTYRKREGKPFFFFYFFYSFFFLLLWYLFRAHWSQQTHTHTHTNDIAAQTLSLLVFQVYLYLYCYVKKRFLSRKLPFYTPLGVLQSLAPKCVIPRCAI